MISPEIFASDTIIASDVLASDVLIEPAAFAEPVVAIIFATYNNAEIAATCLLSCLGQSYKRVRVIVADDGSSDHTRESLRVAAGNDARFTLIELPHGERGAARAAATQMAASEGVEFFYVMDSDMILEPNLVKSCVSFFEKRPGVGALVIPERPFSHSTNLMSRVKVFERRVMNNGGQDLGRNSIEAARFWRLRCYQSTGGINAGQIAFEETQPTIRFLERGGKIKRATFTGVAHDEKHVTLAALLEKKRYYFSVMDKTISSEEGGLWKAVTRSYFFRPVLYRRQNLRLYAQNPLLALGMFGMYFLLSAFAALDIARGLQKNR